MAQQHQQHQQQQQTTNNKQQPQHKEEYWATEQNKVEQVKTQLNQTESKIDIIWKEEGGARCIVMERVEQLYKLNPHIYTYIHTCIAPKVLEENLNSKF